MLCGVNGSLSSRNYFKANPFSSFPFRKQLTLNFLRMVFCSFSLLLFLRFLLISPSSAVRYKTNIYSVAHKHKHFPQFEYGTDRDDTVDNGVQMHVLYFTLFFFLCCRFPFVLSSCVRLCCSRWFDTHTNKRAKSELLSIFSRISVCFISAKQVHFHLFVYSPLFY